MVVPLYVATANFNPRSPHGERLESIAQAKKVFAFQSTLPARGATKLSLLTFYLEDISIHAPRTGSDLPQMPMGSAIPFQSTLPARGATHTSTARTSTRQISIHAPRTGSDICWVTAWSWKTTFQSTLPARGATSGKHGESGLEGISIHAPRTGSDDAASCRRTFVYIFQSTLPARGATHPLRRTYVFKHISIHAPRTGSDDTDPITVTFHLDFNPRSPHGERRFRGVLVFRDASFQSTLPARGATRARRVCGRAVVISIHAPRTGSDARAAGYSAAPSSFQSTLPARGATFLFQLFIRPDQFQSTLPARGATL